MFVTSLCLQCVNEYNATFTIEMPRNSTCIDVDAETDMDAPKDTCVLVLNLGKQPINGEHSILALFCALYPSLEITLALLRGRHRGRGRSSPGKILQASALESAN